MDGLEEHPSRVTNDRDSGRDLTEENRHAILQVKGNQSKVERGGDFHCPSARMATEASVRFTIRLLNLFMVEM